MPELKSQAQSPSCFSCHCCNGQHAKPNRERSRTVWHSVARCFPPPTLPWQAPRKGNRLIALLCCFLGCIPPTHLQRIQIVQVQATLMAMWSRPRLKFELLRACGPQNFGALGLSVAKEFSGFQIREPCVQGLWGSNYCTLFEFCGLLKLSLRKRD